jgi:hypothetical protein
MNSTLNKLQEQLDELLRRRDELTAALFPPLPGQCAQPIGQIEARYLAQYNTFLMELEAAINT